MRAYSPGSFSLPPSDQVLKGIRSVAADHVSRRIEHIEFPSEALLSLVDELMRMRRVNWRLLQETVAAKPGDSEGTIDDRPTDAELTDLRTMWRVSRDLNGPNQLVRLSVDALLTLLDELVECRKAPRA